MGDFANITWTTCIVGMERHAKSQVVSFPIKMTCNMSNQVFNRACKIDNSQRGHVTAKAKFNLTLGA